MERLRGRAFAPTMLFRLLSVDASPCPACPAQPGVASFMTPSVASLADIVTYARRH